MIHLFVASNYPVIRAGLRAILDASPECEVVGEGTLEDLVHQTPSLRPEVVLLDLPTDDQEELETLWRLLGNHPQMGVVVLSGDPGESLAREALNYGARGFLLRDVSPEEIVDTVRAVHQGLIVLHPATARTLLSPAPALAPPAAGEPLTARELEVLQLLAQGFPSKTIASRLKISEHTVKFHVGAILGKLGAASRTEAVTIAIRRGLIAL